MVKKQEKKRVSKNIIKNAYNFECRVTSKTVTDLQLTLAHIPHYIAFSTASS